MRQALRCTLIAVLFGALPAMAETEFDLVNRLRAQVGLPVLIQEDTLTAAAALHAGYLDKYHQPGEDGQGLSAHAQRSGVEGFSGETPAARALAAGYPHREVLENVSMGYGDADSALSGLMSAIYHRLTFLDFESDQLGVAVGEHSRVFLLGRSDLAELCQSTPSDALLRVPVDCLGQEMTRDYYDALCGDLPEQALFRSSHSIACPNGTLLDADFMASVCDQPPGAARFLGHGRYYVPCGNGTKVDADWFNALCDKPSEAAAYTASGRFYELCEPLRRVSAEWLEERCSKLPVNARYKDSGHYRRPCAGDVDIRVEYLDKLDADGHARLPDFVVWPPQDAQSVPPAFFVEEPDPLPDLEVSGYPVSIQFNPARSTKPELREFSLYRIEGDTRARVQDVRLLDSESDPNGLLSAHEFALFPLQRLAWGARYEVVVEALIEGAPQRYAWQFETQGQGLPLLVAPGPTQRFVVQSGRDYLLYLPPRERNAYTVLSTRTEHLRGNRVNLEVVDPNTLRIRIDVRYCDRINIQFNDDHVVELVPLGCAG